MEEHNYLSSMFFHELILEGNHCLILVNAKR